MQLIPAILTDSLNEAQADLDRYARFSPQPKVVQVDIIDGEYADNLTIEAGALQTLDSHGLQVDVHFLVIEPTFFLGELENNRNIRRVIAQIEKMSDVTGFLQIVTEDLGAAAGLSLDLYTPFAALEPDWLDQLAVVQVLGGQGGFQGQEFHPSALTVVQEAREYRDRHGLSYEISVDIGMNPDTIQQVLNAGATECVIGSYLHGEVGASRWTALSKVAPSTA